MGDAVEIPEEDHAALCQRGRIVAHCSDGSGDPDVGISVGLGSDQYLYAGELPNPFSIGIKLYSHDMSILIANNVDYDMARTMIEVIGATIRPSQKRYRLDWKWDDPSDPDAQRVPVMEEDPEGDWTPFVTEIAS